MANDLNVGSLSIKITENSAQAAENLQKLTQSLSAIKSATTGFKGLEKIANSLTLIAKSGESLTGLSNITEKLNGFVQGMNSLNGIQTPKMSKTKNAVTIITELTNTINSMPTIDGAKITALSAALSPLETIGKTNLGTTLTNLKKLPEIALSLNGVDFSAFSQRMGTLSYALTPLESIAKTNLGSVITQLKKIPEMAKTLAEMDMDGFATAIQRVTNAIQPLANEMVKVSNGFSALPSKIQKIIQNNEKLTTSNNKTTKSYNFLNSAFANFTAKMGLYYVTIKRVIGTVGDWVQSSNEYIENLNLFTVAMGDGAEAALEFAQEANEALGIDVSEFIRNQGIFQSVATGFGLASDEASLMSKNLTQLGYDISSFFNTTVEESMLKIQSGIAGELEPLRRLGFALDQATLQQLAYSLGIEKSYSAMTQAEKAELRYYAILTQQKQVLGDMARTITSPANAMRILSQQTEQLTRALGNLFIPILIKVLPYVQAFVKVLTEAVQRLAELMGFELPTIDYSNVGKSITTGITEEADGATEAVKKLKSTLAGIDQLNILSFDDGTDTAGAVPDTGGSLGIDLPTYNFLDGLEEQSDSVYKKVKGFFDGLVSWIQGALPLIETLGVVLGGIWAYDKAQKFVSWFKGTGFVSAVLEGVKGFDTVFAAGGGSLNALKSGLAGFRSALSPVVKLIAGVAGFLAMFATWKTGIKDITKGTKSWSDALATMLPITVAIGAAMYVILGPIGLVVAAVGGLAGALVGLAEGQEEVRKEFANTSFFDDTGFKIDTLKDKMTLGWEETQKFTDKISELKSQIETNNGTLEDSQESFEYYQGLLQTTGNLTFEQTEKMKGYVSTFVSALKQGLEFDSNLVFEAFKKAAAGAADSLDLSLAEMAGYLESFKSRFNTVVDGLETEVNAKLDIIASGGKLTDDEQRQLDEDLAELADYNTVISESQVKFQNLQNDVASVNWGSGSESDIENAVSQIKEIQEAAKQMQDDLDLAKLTTQTSWANVDSKLLALYENERLTKEEYEGYKSNFDSAKSATMTAFDEQRAQIDSDISATLGALYGDLDSRVKEIQSESQITIGDRWDAHWQTGMYSWFDGGKQAKSVADSKINDQFSELYKAIDNASIELKVEIDVESGEELLKNMTITSHANGGFVPSSADMFIANENGIPEMVGTIGGRTAVANNDQIVQAVSAGVENAVYRAMSAANSGNSGEDGTSVAIYLDGDLIYDGVQRRQRQELIRSNGKA